MKRFLKIIGHLLLIIIGTHLIYIFTNHLQSIFKFSYIIFFIIQIPLSFIYGWNLDNIWNGLEKLYFKILNVFKKES